MPRRRSPRRTALLALAVTLALGSSLAWPASAAVAPPGADELSASAALTPPSGLLWGAFVARGSAPDSEQALAAFETSTGRKLDVVRVYSRWDSAMTTAPVRSVVARGRTPVWSVSPQTTSGVTLSWASIAAGAHDDDIAAQAAAVASLGVPVFLVFHHEPDYASGYGTPAEYRAAFRHYVAVFRSRGVTNVAWTWVVTPGSFGSSPATAGADAFYPGDDVVDWLGLDAYNWYGCRAGGPTSWRPLKEAITPFRQWALPHAKPLMLAEWGSVEDPAQPGRKAAWWTEAMSALAGYPEVKAALAFDGVGSCSWLVGSSASSLAAFGAAGSSAAAHGRASAWLDVSTTQGPAPLAVTFDGSRSAGSGRGTGTGVTSWTLAFGDGMSASGVGQPPGSVGHSYAAGTWTSTLTVTDASGSRSTDSRVVTSAALPRVSASESGVTASSVTLNTWVTTFGQPGSVTVSWGPTTAYGSSRTVALGPLSSSQATVTTVTGLRPGSTLYVRVVATVAAGSTVLTRKVSTPGPPTFGWVSVSGRTSSAATVSGGIDPHRLPASTWIEYGPTPALGSTATGPALAALTYEKGVAIGLSGLLPGRTYFYRFGAENSAGRSTGPVGSFTTLG